MRDLRKSLKRFGKIGKILSRLQTWCYFGFHDFKVEGKSLMCCKRCGRIVIL